MKTVGLRRGIILGCFLLYLATMAFGQRYEPYPNYTLFRKIRVLWKHGDYKKLRNLLDQKVTIYLGSYRGRYAQDHLVGILKAYFSKIQVVKFKYRSKKMSISRGVVIYRYRLKSTGVLYKKRLYIYLKKVYTDYSDKWVIVSIHEI